jgi:hypothetical protein
MQASASASPTELQERHPRGGEAACDTHFTQLDPQVHVIWRQSAQSKESNIQKAIVASLVETTSKATPSSPQGQEGVTTGEGQCEQRIRRPVVRRRRMGGLYQGGFILPNPEPHQVPALPRDPVNPEIMAAHKAQRHRYPPGFPKKSRGGCP